MNQIPWGIAAPIFLATLPLLGAMLWNAIDVRTLRTEMRAEFAAIRVELAAIRADIVSIRERLAILEERDRLTHPVLVK